MGPTTGWILWNYDLEQIFPSFSHLQCVFCHIKAKVINTINSNFPVLLFSLFRSLSFLSRLLSVKFRPEMASLWVFVSSCTTSWFSAHGLQTRCISITYADSWVLSGLWIQKLAGGWSRQSISSTFRWFWRMWSDRNSAMQLLSHVLPHTVASTIGWFSLAGAHSPQILWPVSWLRNFVRILALTHCSLWLQCASH